MAKRIVTIISGIEHSLGMENYLRLLSGEKYTNTVILLHSKKGELAKVLEAEGLEVIWIPYHGKGSLFKAFRSLVRILKKIQPDIVHTHLFEASILGIHAARYCGIKKRISTRHHSTLHHVSHPKAVKYDRWINNSSTHLVSISRTISKVLMEMENVPKKKIVLIHHGFDLRPYQNPSPEKLLILKNKYQLKQGQKLIGVISRAVEWKGVQYTIEAFRQINLKFPETVLILGNFEGDYKDFLTRKLETLSADSYRILDHESNAALVYELFSLFVHVPVDDHSEAFGQVYVEAMAAGKPCVFTRSGIGNSLCQNEVNCLVVNYRDSDSIATALERLLSNPELAESLGQAARSSVKENFKLSEMVSQLEELYDR